MCCLALHFSCALFSLEDCQIKLTLKMFHTPPQGMEYILLTTLILGLVFPKMDVDLGHISFFLNRISVEYKFTPGASDTFFLASALHYPNSITW